MSIKTQETTVVISVSTPQERDDAIRDIYTKLTAESSAQYSIVQDQINRVKIFHNVGKGIRIPIRTYIVIIIPILVDLNPLRSMYGSIDFHLDETINHLQNIVDTLRSMQGYRIVKGDSNVEKFKKLVGELSGINA